MGRTHSLGSRPILQGDDPNVWKEFAVALEKRRLIPGAVRAYRKAFEVGGDDDVRHRLAKLLHKTGQRRTAVDLLSETKSFNLNSYNDFCNFAHWLGAYGTLSRIVNEHAPRLPLLKFRSELAMAYVWRNLNEPDRERACLEAALKDSVSKQQTWINAEAELGDWNIANGSWSDLVRALADPVPRRAAPLSPTLADVETVTDIYAIDAKEGFNIAVDVACASALDIFRFIPKPPRFHVHPRVAGLFARSFPFLEILEIADGQESAHCIPGAVHIRELPLLAHIVHRAKPPPPRAYLQPDAARRVSARDRNLEQSGGLPVVGLCWRSSNNHKSFASNDQFLAQRNLDFDSYIDNGSAIFRKNINLSFFGPFAAQGAFKTIVLQYGLAGWECRHLTNHPVYGAMSVPDIDHFGDLDEIVAELSALDAFVSIPCAYAHLAAALGVPTFVLLNDQTPAYWIWNQRFPIYPHLAAYRKVSEWRDGDMVTRKYDGDWSAVVSQVARDLHKLFDS